MNDGSVHIDVDYSKGYTLSLDEALVDLDAEGRQAATAETVVQMLKGNGSKLRAIREWEVLDEDGFTIQVTFTAEDGTVTKAEW